MFGFGRSQTEKMLMKFERNLMAMEKAYMAGKPEVARAGIQRHTEMIRWFNLESDWSQEEIADWLNERGLVRSFRDDQFLKEMQEALVGF